MSVASPGAPAVPVKEEAVTPAKDVNFTITMPTAVSATEYNGQFEIWDNKTSVEFTGDATPTFDKLIVTHVPAYGDERDTDVYQVKGFKPGDRKWKYLASFATGNLKFGNNDYTFRMVLPDGKRFLEKHYRVYIGQGFASSQAAAAGREPLEVTWHTPVLLPTIPFLKEIKEYDRSIHRLQSTWGSGYDGFGSNSSMPDFNKRLTEGMDFYKSGVVHGGPYDGEDVIVAMVNICTDSFDMPCYDVSRTPQDYVHRKDGTFVRFEPQSNVWFATTLDEKHMIDPVSPKALTSVEKPDAKLTLVEDRGEIFKPSGNPLFVAKQSDEPVYEGENGCLMMTRADGMTAIYDVDLSTFMTKNETTMTVTWNDGETTTDAYMKHAYKGCSMATFCRDTVSVTEANGVLKLDGKSELEKAGTLSNGKVVYREKFSAKEVADLAQSTSPLAAIYNMLPNWEGAPKPPSPAEFYASNPLVYIKDPLGRFIVLQKEKFAPGAECGKPVIYLYPEHEQNVSVRVEPVGGLTVSDPPYKNGWTVRATPESVLHNYADGKTYPYLFWEGDGGAYERSTKGFVVERSQVHATMVDALKREGLNEKETADFLEFWEPKLAASPWTFVTFVPQEQFDKMAPLSVTPVPDTVIRVFMDYAPLEGPLSVEPLKRVAPARKGFTVVEWGGVLHQSDTDAVMTPLR